MPITALPTPPSRSQRPADFAAQADTFLAALPAFGTEANALESNVNAKESAATSAASTATTKAEEAAASAGLALGYSQTANTKAGEAAGSASTASIAASTASGAASAAVAAKEVCEGIEAAIAGGPVASVNGKTGIVTLGVADVGAIAASAGTASGLTLNDGYTEEVYAISGTTPAISPANGSIQTWTLGGASTPTAGTWANGQSITLMIDDGSGSAINWGSISPVWKTNGGTAPILLSTGYTVIQLWKVGGLIYGARVGNA